MAKVAVIKNWSTYQHYSDRNPPWIKLHNNILTSKTWVCLDDASKALAVAIMLLAARTDNRIPADPEYIKRVCYLDTTPNLEKLVHVDFIEIIDLDDSCKQGLANRTTETETEKRSKGASTKKKNPYTEEFEALWLLYPKRDGSNPKTRAYRAYRARLGEGVDHADLVSAVKRYAAWCEAKDKVGTETVMQASRFFGPNEEWKNEWVAVLRLTLPTDQESLWAIRRAIGLQPFYDRVKQCHDEINAKLRADPGLRAKVDEVMA